MKMSKYVKRFISIVAGAALALSIGSAAWAEVEIGAFGIQEVTTDPQTEGYYDELYAAEKYNFKIIRTIATAYDAEAWDKYNSAATTAFKVIKSGDDMAAKHSERLDKLLGMRQALVQIKDEADVVWPLWGDSMPVLTEELDFEKRPYDNPDFSPFLVPYLQEDQSQAKGNLIVVAGGGYTERANTVEGYPVAEAFHALGYNCYVLQRRVSPYSARDIWQDMQRSIRLVRYEVEKRGLGGADMIAATGFSGGSATVLGAIAKNYGDLQPEDLDGSYVPDEIDALNSDLDAALCIYGPNYNPDHGSFQGLESENPNLPAFFLAVGMQDNTGAVADNITLANSVIDRTPLLEYHTFANTKHGFGVGTEGTNSILWIPMADCFMQQVRDIEGEE